MNKTLIALTAMTIAASGAMAATAPAKKAPANKAAAAKVAPKKAAKKPVAKKTTASRIKSTVRDRLHTNPLTGAQAPAAPLPPGPGVQFPAPAQAIFVGTMQCELGTQVSVTPDAADPAVYHINAGKGRSYTMRQVPSTGVVRLEDKQQGATWLQLGHKSMLMDQARGERVADGCQNPQQAARDRELQQKPVDLFR